MFSKYKRQKIGNALEGDVKKATSSYGQMKRKFAVQKEEMELKFAVQMEPTPNLTTTTLQDNNKTTTRQDRRSQKEKPTSILHPNPNPNPKTFVCYRYEGKKLNFVHNYKLRGSKR